MRILALLILAVGAVHLATPAQAQMYDPNYPVCLQVYDDMVHYYIDCSFTSMPQCQATASGRAAECIVNPFFAKAPTKKGPAKPGLRHQRSHKHSK